MSKHRLLLCCGALGLLGAVSVAGADVALGRLFFTPEHRQLLDQQRQTNFRAQEENPQAPMLTINGVVLRSSGKRTIWVNGQARNENAAPDEARIVPRQNNPGRVLVQTGDAHATQAKVGGTVNLNTGESTDLLGEGAITVVRTRRGK